MKIFLIIFYAFWLAFALIILFCWFKEFLSWKRP